MLPGSVIFFLQAEGYVIFTMHVIKNNPVTVRQHEKENKKKHNKNFTYFYIIKHFYKWPSLFVFLGWGIMDFWFGYNFSFVCGLTCTFLFEIYKGHICKKEVLVTFEKKFCAKSRMKKKSVQIKNPSLQDYRNWLVSLQI